MGKIIHYIKHITGSGYKNTLLCGTHTLPYTPYKETQNVREVTCKNCIKILNKNVDSRKAAKQRIAT